MFKARLQLSLAENVFCQGMVVLLNQIVFYFLKCFMFIGAKYVLQFSRRDDLQNTGFDRPAAIENRRIVWTCIFDCGKQGGMKHFIQLPISHCYTFKVVTPNDRCNFFSMLAEKFVG